MLFCVVLGSNKEDSEGVRGKIRSPCAGSVPSSIRGADGQDSEGVRGRLKQDSEVGFDHMAWTQGRLQVLFRSVPGAPEEPLRSVEGMLKSIPEALGRRLVGIGRRPENSRGRSVTLKGLPWSHLRGRRGGIGGLSGSFARLSEAEELPKRACVLLSHIRGALFLCP